MGIIEDNHLIFEWDLEKYLGEKPLKHGEKDWFTDDELSNYLEECNREFDSKMKIKPSEASELPPLDMPDSFTDFLTLMEAIESNLNNGNNRLVVIPQIPIGLQAPILTIKRDNGYIVIEWYPISKDSAWKDAESPLIKSCNQIIRAGAQSYVLSFAKEFALDNISEAAKFIAYYYHSVWGLNQSQIDVQQYKYPQSVPTNQELS